MVEVSAKHSAMTAVARLGPHQEAEDLERSALLAGRREDRKIEDAGDRAQAVGGDADLLAGHVVDVEGDHVDEVGLTAGGRLILRRLEDESAEHVGHAGEARACRRRCRSRAAVRPLRPPPSAPTRWRRMAAPVGVTRSPATPSSRHAKPARIVTVAGAGTGRSPCRVSHQAAAARQRGDAPARTGERRGDAAGGDHVHQRIPVGDFVEMDVLDRHGVDMGFGLGEMAEDGDGFRRGAWRERRRLDPPAHFGEGGRCAPCSWQSAPGG